MLKQYHHIVGGAFRIVDALVIASAWILAYYFRFWLLPVLEVTKGLPPFETYLSLLPLIVILWGSVFSMMKVYRSRRILRRTDEVRLVLKAHAVSILVFVTLTYLISEYRYSRGVILYFALMGAALLTAFRLILRNTLREVRRRGKNLRWVLGIGEGELLERLIQRIEKFPEFGLRVKGVLVSDSFLANLSKEPNSKTFAGKPVFGSYEHPEVISSLLKEQEMDQVLIALPRSRSQALDGVLTSLKEETVDIRFVPDVFDFVTLGCEVEEFDGLPMVNLNSSPMDGWGSVIKRSTDFLLSFVGLLLISPLMLIIAAVVRATSSGPVFFRQERMGLDGRTFSMLKFRTMKEDAEATSGAVWAQTHDPRKTRVGSFLRATSLDELPQLINVLRGDMSLVGPRPERPVFVSKFRNEIPHYMLRHKVKAGMTGWAQINGWRGNTSLDRRIECDLYYIRHWSFGLDLKILLLTLWKGFIHKNAY